MRILRRIKQGCQRRRQDQAGLTLIEALAGMIMLSMGLLTLLPLMTIAIGANELSRDTNDALMVMQNRIEILRTQDVINPGYEVGQVSGFLSA